MHAGRRHGRALTNHFRKERWIELQDLDWLADDDIGGRVRHSRKWQYANEITGARLPNSALNAVALDVGDDRSGEQDAEVEPIAWIADAGEIGPARH